MNKFLYISLCLIAVLSCKTKEKVLIVDGGYLPNNTTEKLYTIESHSIKNDQLILAIEYTGKCKKHQFDLITQGMYLKSNPPKLHLFLRDIHNDNSCNDRVKDTLSFNISEAKYNNTYETNVVLLILSGYDTPIRYIY